MKLSIVIPVFNEQQFIAKVLERVQNVYLEDLDREIIIVDDYSTDGTREFLQEITRAQSASIPKFEVPGSEESLPLNNIKVIFQDKNRGKGAALRRGIREASGDFVIIQDSDLEYDPSDYPKLLDPLRKGIADVVYGSRFLGGPHRVLYFWHYVGNKFLTTISNMLTNLNLTDMETCYKIFRREVLEDIEIKENRFGFEPEITAKITKNGCRIFEVPIAYAGRTYEEGKKVNWKDGVKAIWCILRYNLYT